MAKRQSNKQTNTKDTIVVPSPTQLWTLGITEVTGQNLEVSGREEVNKLLRDGWILLHIYTLKYRDESDGDGTWRERPMAILGKPKKKQVELV